MFLLGSVYESEAYVMGWIYYSSKNKREDRALESLLWMWENYTVKWADHCSQQAMLLLPGSNKAVKVYNLIYLSERFSDNDLAATMVLYLEKEVFQRKIAQRLWL